MSTPQPPPEPAPKPPDARIQWSIILPVFATLAIVAFWVLSSFYFDDKREKFIESGGISGEMVTDEQIWAVRWAFIKMIGITSVLAIATAWAPKIISHLLAITFGIISLVASYYGFSKGLPVALPVGLLIAGMLMPVLAAVSWIRGARAPWAFLTASAFTLAFVLIFAAPKVKVAANINLWTAMGLPALLLVMGAGLVAIAPRYRNTTRSSLP